jgi:hypothetical protein
VSGVLALALILLIAFNLVEPDGAHLGHGPAPEPAVSGGCAVPPATGGPLMRVTALFAIGWLAQVAFLAQQLPILVPRIGDQAATLSVALTTASSLLGRLALATVIDDIAERIRQLGGRPDASLGGALSLKRLQEFPNAGRNAEEYLRALLADLETLVRQLRSDIPAVADVGTQDFLTGLIQQHETSAWKLRASLTA